MEIQELKKLGLKINSLSRKIEEAERCGMNTRISGYVKELENQKVRFDKFVSELKKEYPDEA